MERDREVKSDLIRAWAAVAERNIVGEMAAIVEKMNTETNEIRDWPVFKSRGPLPF